MNPTNKLSFLYDRHFMENLSALGKDTPRRLNFDENAKVNIIIRCFYSMIMISNFYDRY